MTLKEQLYQIIEAKEDITPFLQNLSPKDKKPLVALLKKLPKDFNPDGKGDEYLTNLAKKAYFVCANKKEFLDTRFYGADLGWMWSCPMEKEFIEILEWYVPSWYSEVVNEVPTISSYQKIQALCKKGYLKVENPVIARSLLQDTTTKGSIDHPDYPQLLTKHIWLLFEEIVENQNFHYQNWTPILVALQKEGKIDRIKLLKASLSTYSIGFNKIAGGEFAKLLDNLKPSPQEVLDLQDDFLSALNSPLSKMINTVLKYLKTISELPAFKYKTFIQASSLLLHSDIKSIVNANLVILEKIAKKHKDTQEEICEQACEVLLNTDENLQNKSAKLIQKYGDPKKLSETVANYDSFYLTTKELLKGFIEEKEIEIEENIAIEMTLFSEPMPSYESFDELLFFLNQSIESKESYDTDLLLILLPKLNLLVDKDNVSKLFPIIKRAYDFQSKSMWDNALMDSLTAILIREFAEVLQAEYPKQLDSFTKTYLKKYERWKPLLMADLSEYERAYGWKIAQIYIPLFENTVKALQQKTEHLLLSTPTHAPCWIQPEVLVQRILTIEKTGEINSHDWQIAFARIPNAYVNKGLKDKIDKVKNKMYKQVLLYQFGFDTLPSPIPDYKFFLQSILNRNNKEDIEDISTQFRVDLSVHIGKSDWKVNTRKGIEYTYRSLEIDNKVNPQDKSIYQYIDRAQEVWYGFVNVGDAKRYLILTPNTPSKYLNGIVQSVFHCSFPPEVREKTIGTNTLKGLYDIWQDKDYSDMTYLALASAFIYGDKTIREYTSELWIKGTANNAMNQEKMGKQLGRLFYDEFASLKRLTDLITDCLLHISKQHDLGLLQLIDSILGEMNNKPIKNTKKLLTIFIELLHLYDYEPSKKTLEKLEKWAEVKSLKSVVKKIML